MPSDPRLLANAIRALTMDAVERANSGHPGMPMGMADAATELFARFVKFDPQAPDWPDRDRFVLSAGHGSMLLYSLLHLLGYERPTLEDIRNFRQLSSPCAGHPENFLLPAVEATTGPLGQGLAMAVGMAMAERHLNARFGDDLVDHRTWVIAGDGDLMEGVNHEAAGLAGHLGLGRLVVLWDDNRITIDGPTDLSTNEDIPARYAAYGWHVVRCDGHDPADVRRALEEAVTDSRPSLVACRTIIGHGAPTLNNNAKAHGAPLGPEEVAATREAIGWPHEPFVIPDEVRDAWLEVGRRSQGAHRAWRERLAAHPERDMFTRAMEARLPVLPGISVPDKPVATRKASEAVLEALVPAVPELLGGSADLTGSNNTRPKGMDVFTRDNPAGRYLHYGIREFGMAAAMNGMALHGGVIPYGGTFLVFSDYCRPAIRLSALQGVRVVYVMTHDSIGLGEDGPTHQPVEHVMSLRLIPGLHVYRPADARETAECWALSLERTDGPSLLALSRQNLPPVRDDDGAENRSARGAYRLRAAAAPRRAVLIATGSEVQIALQVAERLEGEGVGADVVSMPSWERFEAQTQAYQDEVLPPVLPDGELRVSIEAGTTRGWERYTMARGLRFGLDGFGASAPAEQLYEHFGLTADAITPKILEAIGTTPSRSG